MFRYLKELPVQLIISILVAMGIGQFLDLNIVSGFYTLSSIFIDLLMFFLPIMVFTFIMRALVNIKRGSFTLILLTFVGVTVSNCVALSVAYCFGQAFLPHLQISHSPDFAEHFKSSVEILFSLDLPTVIRTEVALILGIVIGLAISLLPDTSTVKITAQNISQTMTNFVTNTLKRVFIPILPLYVFGFCLKLSYDHALVHLLQQYGKVFIVSMLLVIAYIGLLYLVAAKGNPKRALQYMARMLPAGLTGFSTMSSAASMPLVLEATKENTGDENFSNLVIPATSNIHMLGDDLTIILTAMTLMSVFGQPWIDPMAFVPFALAFSIAKLSCVGVPGASVLVVLPVLQHYLGFSPEMISLLTTIYILQDPFGTTANVMGNGAFALIIQRAFKRVQRIARRPDPVTSKS